ncbi:MAG: hypothetical protein KGQ70_08610 [Alphaproteobacteria bacterium]|nr:hypothetical protein [Alphaproteobacteria bacterium]
MAAVAGSLPEVGFCAVFSAAVMAGEKADILITGFPVTGSPKTVRHRPLIPAGK